MGTDSLVSSRDALISQAVSQMDSVAAQTLAALGRRSVLSVNSTTASILLDGTLSNRVLTPAGGCQHRIDCRIGSQLVQEGIGKQIGIGAVVLINS